MDQDEAAKLYRECHREYAEAVELIKVTNQRMDGLLSVMAGIETLFPDLMLDEDLPPVGKPYSGIQVIDDVRRRPKGQDAVRAVLVANRARPFTVAEMTAELEARGWLPDSQNPSNAVRTALERLMAAEPRSFLKAGGGEGVMYGYMPRHEEPDLGPPIGMLSVPFPKEDD